MDIAAVAALSASMALAALSAGCLSAWAGHDARSRGLQGSGGALAVLPQNGISVAQYLRGRSRHPVVHPEHARLARRRLLLACALLAAAAAAAGVAML